MILRLAKMEDLEQVVALAHRAPVGLTTLPDDEHRLKLRIEESVKNSFYPPEKAGGESFFFVLEKENKIIGCSAVFSKVGGFKPFWTYEIKDEVKRSDKLDIETHTSFLQVKKVYDGPSEVGTLFLLPEYRGSHCGRLLSLGRFLFMACFRHLFELEVLAEMRGRVDADGYSPFWEAVGQKFFHLSFNKADLMTNEDKSFIDELMPSHPIYISMLPKAAQDVIGQVHEKTIPALTLLKNEGFEVINEVDIFEAGPVAKCHVENIRTVRESQEYRQSCLVLDDDIKDGYPFLVAAYEEMASFRVSVISCRTDKSRLVMKTSDRDFLALESCTKIRAVRLFEGESTCIL